jgi:hypothetical protein
MSLIGCCSQEYQLCSDPVFIFVNYFCFIPIVFCADHRIQWDKAEIIQCQICFLVIMFSSLWVIVHKEENRITRKHIWHWIISALSNCICGDHRIQWDKAEVIHKEENRMTKKQSWH